MAWFDFGGLGDVLETAQDRLTNSTSVVENRYCERCRKITRHVSISFVAADRLRKGRSPRLIESLVGHLNDWNPMALVLPGRPFRCGGCGRVEKML